MMQEPGSTSPADQTQQPKPTTNRRANRQARNRPVLVTSDNIKNNSDPDIQATTPDTDNQINSSPANETAEVVETPRQRRLPSFFSRVGKSEQAQENDAMVSPTAARLARATRGKVTTEPKKQETQQPIKNTPTAARSAPARPTGFKFRYIWGMLFYLLAADVVGVFEANYLRAHGLDALLFQLGPVAIYRSTALFLLTLVVLLLVLARFDLIPRNLGAAMGQPTPQNKTGQSRTTSGSATTKTPPPTIRQGVKGENDDLYEEYQAQRRYNQRRERKR